MVVWVLSNGISSRGCPGWHGPSELDRLMKDMEKGEAPHSTLKAACGLFGKDNVRFYGHGIPNVFLDGGRVTDSAVTRLLTWENGKL